MTPSWISMPSVGLAKVADGVINGITYANRHPLAQFTASLTRLSGEC